MAAVCAVLSHGAARGSGDLAGSLERGGDNDRGGLLEAMSLVRAGRVQQLVVTRLDRLSRDAAYADQLVALCSLRGVELLALDGGKVESATPQGFLLARMATTQAEFERRMLSQRIRRNFEVYRRQGRHLRGRKPFGYRGGADHRLEPHPEQWPLALRVLERLRAVGSFSRVSQELPRWCPDWTPAPGSLHSWFMNPVIRGHVGYGVSGGKGWGQRWREIKWNQHPALIGEQDWQELKVLLQGAVNRYGLAGPSPPKHGLSGLLRCGTCGHRLQRNSSGGHGWWRCRYRACTARGGVREDRVLPIVVAACVEAAATLARLAEVPMDEDPALVARRQDLNALRQLAARNPALEAAVAAEEEAISAMEQRPRLAPQVAVYEQLLSDPAFFSEATAEEQRALFGGVLQEVRVFAGGECRAVRRSW